MPQYSEPSREAYDASATDAISAGDRHTMNGNHELANVAYGLANEWKLGAQLAERERDH